MRACKVCGGEMPPVNLKYVCCSAECSRIWGTAKRHLDEESYIRHREANATSILRSPDKYPPSLLAWAGAILGPSPPEPNRRFRVAGSKATQAVEAATTKRRKAKL